MSAVCAPGLGGAASGRHGIPITELRRLRTQPVGGVALDDGFLRSTHMGKKLYVGNLGYGIRNSDLEQLFAAHGTVRSAEVITDRTTGQLQTNL